MLRKNIIYSHKFFRKILILPLSLFLLLTTGCNPENKCVNESQKVLYSSLQARIQQSSYTPERTLNIQYLTKFEWDKLYIFEPYTSKEDINKILGFKWSSNDCTEIDSSDKANLLVFVKDGIVTNPLEYPRTADFDKFASKFDSKLKRRVTTSFTPETAIFSVKPDPKNSGFFDLTLVRK